MLRLSWRASSLLFKKATFGFTLTGASQTPALTCAPFTAPSLAAAVHGPFHPLPQRCSLSTEEAAEAVACSAEAGALLTRYLQEAVAEGDDARHRRQRGRPQRETERETETAELEEDPLESQRPTCGVHKTVVFAELSKRRRRLQQLQTPSPPKRRRGPAATLGQSGVYVHSTQAGGLGGLRLLQPAAVVATLRRAARNNARDGRLWRSLCRRVCLVAPGLSPAQITTVLHSAARIR